MTTPTDRVRAALNIAIADTDSSVVRELLRKARRELDGKCLVPVEPTREMLNAAVDVDTFRLGDISPLGFRISPQRLFEKCYAAMIAPYVGEKE